MEYYLNMNIEEFFRENPKCAVAFSGGVDSSFLLYAACKYAEDVTGYYVRSAFQPAFELEDAIKLAEQIGCRMKVLPVDVLKEPAVCANPKDRCYHCKQVIFRTILEAAAADGYEVLLDGTNASDDAGDRPGMRALAELGVRSPLRECGLSKDEIRRLSQEAGLFTWNKPAYACLATRIPEGEEITEIKLQNIEKAETYLFSIGLSDLRVRTRDGRARLQVRKEQLGKVLECREDILEELGKYYSEVTLDLNTR